jgi:MORC family CW-type zinc finger protein
VFGKSAKRYAPDANQIGQYGNGLKSGAMRIANDFILFTKKNNIGTCLLLSRSFHQEEHISQVICPIPCFDLNTRQPIDNNEQHTFHGTRAYTFDAQKHELEMRLIMKYSPFKTTAELFEQFDLIKSDSGTLIVLYNMKLSGSGDAELDIRTDPYDLLIDHHNRRNTFDDEEMYFLELMALMRGSRLPFRLVSSSIVRCAPTHRFFTTNHACASISNDDE